MILDEKDDTIELLKKLYAEKLSNDETWQYIADRYYELTGIYKTANAIRKQISRLNSKNICWYEDGDNADDLNQTNLSDVVPANRFEKVIKSDERTEINAIYRRITREQTIKDIARETADIIAEKNPFITFNNIGSKHSYHNTNNVGTLLISDWHYGMYIDNPFNKYDENIFKKRLENLLTGTVKYIEEYKIANLNIFNLGDMIAGRIHNTIRIQNRIDVITQIIEVSEYIANFIFELSKYVKISYYDCLDNHSRLEPNLKDSLDLESLVRITHWYLKERFNNVENIVVFDNEYGYNIITANICGHSVVAVHGHNDSPAKVIEDLSLMTRTSYDLVCTAHFHHFQMDERNNCIFISNPSLMGTDEFAEKLRLSSKPSQVFIYHTKENVVEGIHRILV